MMTKSIISLCVLCLLAFAHQAHALRVVSVGGGLTEIIYALNAQDTLVGVDTTSQYPESTQSLPQVGYMRALSVEGIASLKPDYVFVTDDAGPPHSLEQLKQINIDVVKLNSELTLNGLLSRVDKLAAYLGKKNEAELVKKTIVEQEKDLQTQLKKQKENKSALFILSHGGHALSIAGQGTAAHSMLEMAGLKNVAHEFKGYRILGQEGLVGLNPDIIITSRQGVEAWGGESRLLQQEGIQFTKAAQQGKLLSMDAMYLLGFGPRVFQAANELHQKAYF